MKKIGLAQKISEIPLEKKIKTGAGKAGADGVPTP